MDKKITLKKLVAEGGRWVESPKESPELLTKTSEDSYKQKKRLRKRKKLSKKANNKVSLLG